MEARAAPPGEAGQRMAGKQGRHEVVADRPGGLWEDFLAEPDEGRIGIAASGGGVRSASFALGGLQVLRRIGILGTATHLACVSGGGYITIAHSLLVHESLQGPGPRPRDDVELAEAEDELFTGLPPWAPDSPEERNLRDHLSYLAPGVAGRTWLWLNLAYGLIRHLLPFVATIYGAGFVVGLSMSGWLGPCLRLPNDCAEPSLGPFLWAGVLLLAIAASFVTIRVSLQKRSEPPEEMDSLLPGLQQAALVAIAVAGAELALLWALPHILLWLPHAIDDIGRAIARVTGAAALIGGIAAFVFKRWGSRLIHVALSVLVSISGPLFLLAPFVGFAYWNAKYGLRDPYVGWRVGLAVLSGVMLALLFFWFDETMSTAHLFYRERLATAFVGLRVVDTEKRRRYVYAQPNWHLPLRFSAYSPKTQGRDPALAKMPNLVICAAVNATEAPVGRLGASFTFERDKSGGPLTGYVPTRWIEENAPGGAGTLPGLMAISGAAVAPSMGKLTLPGLRFLMAVFNLRLGVWLPNPRFHPSPLTAARLREGVAPEAPLAPLPAKRKDNPGGWYVFREAFGMNDVKRRKFVYVTDGGHWENIGLVELLRRGCTRVIVLDGSGGRNDWFDTMSEAIALARADLGVEVDIDLGPLKADKKTKRSAAAYAVGRLKFPDGTKGVIVYVRSVVPEDAPPEIAAYAASHPKFPNHPLPDQFFGDATFEAYRSLGKHLVERVTRAGWFGGDPGDPAHWRFPKRTERT